MLKKLSLHKHIASGSLTNERCTVQVKPRHLLWPSPYHIWLISVLSKTMKVGIAIICFAAGCLCSILVLAWYVTVLTTRHSMWPFPSSILRIEALFVAWGLVMFATFYRSSRSIWPPLFEISSGRIKTGKLVLACTFINCVVWLLICLGIWVAQIRGLWPWTFCLLVSAITLLNTVLRCHPLGVPA